MSSPDTTAPRQGLGWRLALLLVAVLLVAGYALAALSYGASLNTPTLSTAAPSGGVAVTFVPQQLLDTSQQAVGYLLLFPDAGLLDADDTLRADITVTFEPTVGAGTVIFRQGQAPAPQRISLPTPGVVEEYPFDSYQIDAVVRAAVSASDATGGGARSLPVTTDLLFRIPG